MKILIFVKKTDANDAEAAKILLHEHEVTITNDIEMVTFFLKEKDKYYDLIFVSGYIEGVIIAAICKPVFSVCNLMFFSWKKVPDNVPNVLRSINRVNIEDEWTWISEDGKVFPLRPKDRIELLEVSRLQLEKKLRQVKNWPKFLECVLNFQLIK